ncbi:hypothetical protein WJX73_006161 [Symbiochloris irregularis]|uniref:Uncharacterized protein n=1 Tax=Symbiochloris irregularis TaxID=706552 RepID=A0AAW1PEY5_9CHLO
MGQSTLYQQSASQTTTQTNNNNQLPQGISGRRLSGSIDASASSSVFAGQGINQQASNQAIKQTGNGGQAAIGTTGTNKCSGRRLLNA